jgi:hypothetical protein
MAYEFRIWCQNFFVKIGQSQIFVYKSSKVRPWQSLDALPTQHYRRIYRANHAKVQQLTIFVSREQSGMARN